MTEFSYAHKKMQVLLYMTYNVENDEFLPLMFL